MTQVDPQLISQTNKDLIVESIRSIEKQTSGEIRVVVDTRVASIETLEPRMNSVYELLAMETATNQPAVLIFVAPNIKLVRVKGSRELTEIVGGGTWTKDSEELSEALHKDVLGKRILEELERVGKIMIKFFPGGHTDNELPDDIVVL